MWLLSVRGSHAVRRFTAVVLISLVAVASQVSAAPSKVKVSPKSADENSLTTYPAPASLPPVHFPAFRFIHPRLPAPTFDELELIRKRNPDYLRYRENSAKAGAGELDAIILLARAKPGSQDLNVLYTRLMALKFSWRGHEQGKPLAIAYDWLYDQWSPQQKEHLRNKLAEGCNYLIERIRSERLSPYNVYLYNSPFQALMACTLALYGDDPRGDLAMRFTNDYWKNRMLPVWRQIMGKNGGWHEGKEYVGIGIGQAVYQLPAMWRTATGEDLFASEPGIRGFSDFLIYRTRPDGAQAHFGDGAHLDRRVPDFVPLALEYGNPAAYTLAKPPRSLEPTSWPWGPLTDNSLVQKDALSALPLSRFFDGTGLLVARSDWTPEATYVTFQAGDNYWSHSHLDQGSFTIYKGGALAIDSGWYGPAYGADHHMNYTYQAIAHNTVTVTDPKDTVAAPAKKGGVRKIANDGGQRRVGSGWGVESAPLDLAEWQRKREIYHTGTMERVLEDNGLAVAIADLTPAYTNRFSGKGTFSHRTRRVERFWRTFGYDQVDDVVVVFDKVRATKRDFRKRWLLHTLEKPETTAQGLSAGVAAIKASGHAGGRLDVRVLLPERASVEVIGGKEAAFLVDGTNYDEGGKVAAAWEKRPELEVGNWRVEVSPASPAVEDLFLVVLLPTDLNRKPAPEVRLLKKDGRVGCEIKGPLRTTTWWFDADTNSCLIEVVQGGKTYTYDLRPEVPQDPLRTKPIGGAPARHPESP